jgi:hypothetical protein
MLNKIFVDYVFSKVVNTIPNKISVFILETKIRLIIIINIDIYKSFSNIYGKLDTLRQI